MNLSSIRSKVGVIVASVMIAVTAVIPTTAFADSSKVVTLGNDLTAEQRTTVLNFFGLTEDDLQNMQTITVTNQDERQYLEGTVSSEVIGNKTLSCSYIEPTTSGGINVETANLTYVTKNTLYNALQTAGIENCNLVVTAPYPVSGTGALTGVFMAYEKDGQTLDEDKKEAATEEMVDTANLESKYGDKVAEVVSDVKKDVVNEDGTLTDDQIRNLIKVAAQAKGITLSDSDVDTILEIAKRVQGMDYGKDSFSNTLSDAKASIDNATEQASGVLGDIQSFFKSIGDFFSNLFGLAQDKANEGKGILENLNTNVYSLDSGNTTDNTADASNNNYDVDNSTSNATNTEASNTTATE